MGFLDNALGNSGAGQDVKYENQHNFFTKINLAPFEKIDYALRR